MSFPPKPQAPDFPSDAPLNSEPTRRVALLGVAASVAAVASVGSVGCASGPTAPQPPLNQAAPPIRRAGIEAAPPTRGAQAKRAGVAANGALQRIAVVSCIDQTKPLSMLDSVRADQPGLVLFSGDNVYASKQPFQLSALDEAYRTLAASPSFAALRDSVAHMAVWDDHDYGLNDGGAEFPAKQESKNYFMRFWRVAASDPRNWRDGVYSSQVFGPAGQRVQVIMPDTRWFRSAWRKTDQRDAPGKERYVPDADPSKTMLGELQWQWLEAQLRQPADLRLIVSSLQVLAEGHGWERWGLFPLERQRLFDTIARTQANGVVMLSGDRHIGAIYRDRQGAPYTLTEMTSSGMTHTWETANEPGPNRMGGLVTHLHFGTVEIDWATRALALQLKNVSGQVVQEQVIAFDSLRVGGDGPNSQKLHIK